MKPAFLFDGMLGRLCRKMRMLGYDCALAGLGESSYLLLRAENEGRIAVTTATRHLDRRGAPPIVLQKTGLAERIAELLGKAGGPPVIEPFTRCLECNALLRKITTEEAKGHVPPRIISEFKEFHACTECGRVYWKGTHYESMAGQVDRIARLLHSR